jgi:deoxycytidylate deaminase
MYVDPIRLRYDRQGIARNDPVPAAACTSKELHRRFMRHAGEEAKKSRDWWLSVGAVASRDGVPLLMAHNEAALDPDLPNILGDPRSAYARGENTEDTLVLHAERSLVSQAAYYGISLRGADAYVTHFPCVPCAASLADAGIKGLYFMHGYSRLESAELLASKGVEVFRVV